MNACPERVDKGRGVLFIFFSFFQLDGEAPPSKGAEDETGGGSKLNFRKAACSAQMGLRIFSDSLCPPHLKVTFQGSKASTRCKDATLAV